MDIKTEPGDYRNPYEVCRLCLSEEALNDVFDEEGLHQWISDYLSIMVVAIVYSYRETTSVMLGFRYPSRTPSVKSYALFAEYV